MLIVSVDLRSLLLRVSILGVMDWQRLLSDCRKKKFTETQNEYHFLTIRHSGESRNPVKTTAYWMPVFTGMTV
jgi:hypothetical protein